jgi:hypothetical protein
MPGLTGYRARFSEIEKSADRILYSERPRKWIGTVCQLAIVFAVGIGPATGIRVAIGELAGQVKWEPSTLGVLVFCGLGLTICMMAGIEFTRLGIISARIELDPVRRTLRYEMFRLGRPRGERTLTAAEIAKISLVKSRGNHLLVIDFNNGRTWRLDASKEPAPLERLANDISATLGVPIDFGESKAAVANPQSPN